MSNKQLIGYIGLFILILGGFVPVSPLGFGYDKMAYFESIDTLIIFVIVIPLLSGTFIYLKKFTSLGVLSSFLIVWNLLLFIIGIDGGMRLKSQISTGSDDNLTDGLNNMKYILQGGSNQIPWGWLLPLAGSLLLFYCAYKKEEKPE